MSNSLTDLAGPFGCNQDTEKHDALMRLRAAARHGKICGKCGRKLRDGEPVWRERHSTGRYFSLLIGTTIRPGACAPLCAKCRFKWRDVVMSGKRICGRLVHFTDQRWRRAAFCCDDCRDRYQSKHQAEIARQRRAEARGASRPCGECGEHFEPSRADSKFCSAACKQKAYRKRDALRFPIGDHCLQFESRNGHGRKKKMTRAGASFPDQNISASRRCAAANK